MSKFCGKCDFYDGFCMIAGDGDEEKIKENLTKLELYVHGKDGRDHRVKSDTIKDIAKYYPYLEAMMFGSNDGKRTVILASDSFIDQEEREHLQYKIDDVMKYHRKCKRNKQPFNEEECLAACSYWRDDDEVLKEIIHRVAISGNKAEFDDIHMPLWEHYRRGWFEELVSLGYTEYQAYNWCFKGLFDPDEVATKRLGRPLKKD